MNEELNLKNCPFCGSNQITLIEYYNFGLYFEIQCSKCRARGQNAKKREKAIQTWNKRA